MQMEISNSQNAEYGYYLVARVSAEGTTSQSNVNRTFHYNMYCPILFLCDTSLLRNLYTYKIQHAILKPSVLM